MKAVKALQIHYLCILNFHMELQMEMQKESQIDILCMWNSAERNRDTVYILTGYPEDFTHVSNVTRNMHV